MTPRLRVGGTRRRGDQTLADVDARDPALAMDFDFESNLALFDKRALWEQMKISCKPDLVSASVPTVMMR